VMAIRGWLKGFVLQAIRLGGLVACVFAADPVRDVSKPEILPYLPTIRPELIDRGLWWTSAVLSYVVLVGFASLAVKLYRRKPFGLEERNRSDQIAGSMLGIAKGFVLVAFLTAGIQQYALGHLQSLPWAAGARKNIVRAALERGIPACCANLVDSSGTALRQPCQTNGPQRPAQQVDAQGGAVSGADRESDSETASGRLPGIGARHRGSRTRGRQRDRVNPGRAPQGPRFQVTLTARGRSGTLPIVRPGRAAGRTAPDARKRFIHRLTAQLPRLRHWPRDRYAEVAEE